MAAPMIRTHAPAAGTKRKRGGLATALWKMPAFRGEARELIDKVLRPHDFSVMRNSQIMARRGETWAFSERTDTPAKTGSRACRAC